MWLRSCGVDRLAGFNRRAKNGGYNRTFEAGHCTLKADGFCSFQCTLSLSYRLRQRVNADAALDSPFLTRSLRLQSRIYNLRKYRQTRLMAARETLTRLLL